MSRPATVLDVYLRCLGGLLGLALLAYACQWVWDVQYVPRAILIAGLVLLTLGWLPARARSARGHQLALALASVVAVPFARAFFDTVMHDLPATNWWVVGEHARWCVPQEGMIITSGSAPLILFMPVALVALTRVAWARKRPA